MISPFVKRSVDLQKLPVGYRLNPTGYIPKQMDKLNTNEQKWLQGVKNKEAVVPKHVSIYDNKIGFIQENHPNSSTTIDRALFHLVLQDEIRNLRARISFVDFNRMHQTPTNMNEGYQWRITFERTQLIKDRVMGWIKSSDVERSDIRFGDLEEAISYAQTMGWTYEVQYPHFRYHTKKSYADNFKWKGYPQDSEEMF